MGSSFAERAPSHGDHGTRNPTLYGTPGPDCAPHIGCNLLAPGVCCAPHLSHKWILEIIQGKSSKDTKGFGMQNCTGTNGRTVSGKKEVKDDLIIVFQYLKGCHKEERTTVSNRVMHQGPFSPGYQIIIQLLV